MASIKKTPTGMFQLCVRNKLLPKPYWITFDTFEAAERFGKHVEGLLSQGILPVTLVPGSRPSTSWSVTRCMSEYLSNNSVPTSDIKLLDTIRTQLADLDTSLMSYEWADGWIRHMKRVENLSPSTIRHRHGALARCLDWVNRKRPEILGQNPLRLLKRGFASYSLEDNKQAVTGGGRAKVDIERNRRLDPEEEQRILKEMGDADNERVLFVLALETAMRMRECYTLSIDQISQAKKTIHLDRTKNGDGRQVPLSSVALTVLGQFIEKHADEIQQRKGRLFPFWNGDLSVRALDSVTADLSYRFRTIFAKASVADFRFHDLRHEATCRLYERTNLSDVLIARITGHRSLRMLQRYASLRGSDLAAHLW